MAMGQGRRADGRAGGVARRRTPVRTWLAALLLVALFAVDGGAEPAASRLVAQEPPAPAFENVTLVVGGYQAFARFAGARESVMVLAELRRDGTLLARDQQQSSPAGDLEFAFASTGPRARHPVVLRPGDQLRLSPMDEDPSGTQAGAMPTAPSETWTAGPIEAAVGADGTIVGQAPPGQRVTITAANAEGSFGAGSAVADEQGRWAVDLGERLAVGPGTTGTALYVADGVVQQSSWAWRGLTVRVGDPVIEVVDRSGATLEVAILRAPEGDPRAAPVVIAQGEAVVWRGGGQATELVARDSEGRVVAPIQGDTVRVRTPASAGSTAGTAMQDDPRDTTAPPTTLTVEAIDVEVDAQQGRVSGEAVAPAMLHVTAGGKTLPVEVDPATSWVADFRALTPIRPDTAVRIENRATGWSLVAYPRAFTAVGAIEAEAWGRGAAGEEVQLTAFGTFAPDDLGIRPLAYEHRGRIAVDGTWHLALHDARGQPIPLGADTRLQLEARRRLTVAAPPVIARTRASRDLVLGQAPPDSVVTIEVDADPASSRAGVREQLVVDASGSWRADFEGRADLVPGTPISVRVWPPGGLPAELRFPSFRANVQSGGDRVRIEGWPGLRSTVRMERGGKAVAVAECTVVRTTCDALLQALDGGPAPRPSEGDEVLIYPEREAAVTLPVVKLAAHIDLSGADVVGASPPQEPVEITFRHDEGRPTPLEARIGADDNGVFDYELAASQWDLVTPGLVADVYHPRPGGHRLFASGVMESVRAWPGSPRVSGVVEPGTRVSASLHAPAAPSADGAPAVGRSIATGAATGDGLARFELALRDGDGRAVAAQAGTTVVVTHARRTLLLPIQHLAAWRTGPSGAVAGAAPPQQPLRAIHREGDPAGDNILHLEGRSDLAGTFAFPAPPASLSRRHVIEVALELGGGGELRRSVARGDAPAPLWLPVGQR
jgi:hypothetical protein